MTQDKYTPINQCFECLEHFLLFVDFGLSESMAGLLAGLYHIAKEKSELDRFQHIAQEFLRKPLHPPSKP